MQPVETSHNLQVSRHFVLRTPVTGDVGRVFQALGIALVLRKALEDRLAAARLKPEWGALLRELDRLQEIETEQEGKHVSVLIRPRSATTHTGAVAKRRRSRSITGTSVVT